VLLSARELLGRRVHDMDHLDRLLNEPTTFEAISIPTWV
jgi:hypothetical protein